MLRHCWQSEQVPMKNSNRSLDPIISQALRSRATRKRAAAVTLAGPQFSDATPERIAQANRSGLTVVQAKVHDEAGYETGGKRREIMGVIETLHARKCMNDIQFQAGQRFISLWATVARGPRCTQRWDDSPRGGDTPESEALVQAIRQYRASWPAVHRKLWPVLGWLIDTQTAEITPTVADIGLKYQGALGTEAARARGFAYLHFTLDELAVYYGLIPSATAAQLRAELEKFLKRT